MSSYVRNAVVIIALFMLVGCPHPSKRASVTGVVVTPEHVTLVVGEQIALAAVVLPVEADQSVRWSSDATVVATVDQEGVVVAQAVGSAVVTATSVANARRAGRVTVSVIDEDTVVVSDEARVVDEPSMDALSAFDAALGTLRFTTATEFVDALAPGDIVVAGASEVAPHGFLRHVDDVRVEQGEVWLETSSASLEDVIRYGSVTVTEALTADDVEEVELLFEGISVRAGGAPGVAPQSDDFAWSYTFQRVLVDVGTDDDPGRLRVEIDGALGLTIKPTFEISFRWLGLDRLTLQLDIDQRAELNLTALGDAAFDREVVFARKRTTPRTVMIGSVPVVYSYEVELFIGANGKIDARLHVGLEQTFDASFGLSYDHGRSPRWDSHARADFDFVGPDVTFEASGKAEAYAGGRLAMRFYEAVAPTVGIRVFGEIEMTVPGDPVWCVHTGLALDVGFIVDIPILGRILDYEHQVARRRRLVGCADNTPPSISVRVDDATVLLGASTVVRADVTDLEDGAACCTVRWRSSLDGDLGTSSAADPTLRVTLATEGRHTITATAEDSSGATSSATLPIDVVHLPPTVSIGVPSVVQAGVRADLRAFTEDPHETGTSSVPCERVRWSVAGATPGTGTGCVFPVVFASAGSRAVSVEATGRFGAVARADETVVVGAAPDNILTVDPIVVTLLPETIDRTPQCSVGWDDYVDSDVPPTIVLSTSATDQLGRELTYQWCRLEIVLPPVWPPVWPVLPTSMSPMAGPCPRHYAPAGTGPTTQFAVRDEDEGRSVWYPYHVIVSDGGDALGHNVNSVSVWCDFTMRWIRHVP